MLKLENPESLASYREKASVALAKHGGSVVQASKELALLEGGMDLPDLAAVLSFPDQDAARAWRNDPDLQDLHALREGSGQSNLVLL